MKRIPLILGLSALTLSLPALGALQQTATPAAWAEEWSTETRDVDRFTSVRLSGAFEAEITVGDSQSVEIS
ncbi:MAG: hypothetical protein EP347_02215, partial [Alphaproteobacteria bacterium]